MVPASVVPRLCSPCLCSPCLCSSCYVVPAYVVPAYVVPAYVVPAYVVPAYVVPAYVVPAYVVPAYVVPITRQTEASQKYQEETVWLGLCWQTDTQTDRLHKVLLLYILDMVVEPVALVPYEKLYLFHRVE